MGEPPLAQAYMKELIHELKSSKLYTDLQNAAQVEVAKTHLRLSDVRKGVQTGLVNSGWDRKLRNAIFKYIQCHPKIPYPLPPVEHLKEPLLYLRKAQQNWEKRILKSLNSMCTELNMPLARKRPEKDQRDIIHRWTELGTDGPDLTQIRPVYAPKDFLEVIIGLSNPNYHNGDAPGFHHLWGIVQVPLKVKSINKLRLQYSDMAINQGQSGIDDFGDIPPELFESDKMKVGKKVINACHGPLAQEFSKKGCPTSLRASLWCQMLGVEIDEEDTLYYEQLKVNVQQHDLLVDSLLYKDVKLTATNDDQYFVFEDFLYQVLLPFSRDTYVLKHFAQNSATPPKSYIRGKMGQEEFAVIYPPNGVIPFHGFAMYVAPLCYVFNEPICLYYVFREMYCRHFFRLHSISSHPQGILAISLLFETLLQIHEPELYFHLKTVGCHPLKISFKWLVRAFSGYLSSDQVLLLWDRILAHSSLEILAVLAVAIFSFRKTNLMKVQSYNAAEAVLADLTTLQVIPLIQLSLFSK
ncbi:TBC1 domain family member 19-like [Ylistrum balloti]|uniref:TBC1 domain family member 19-like n=1 Tax=Ylistrum balloti TaxID=509963 RepID=UPI002905AF54|nr:TBC1 domain family member 19-like [Ylistrum balloti]